METFAAILKGSMEVVVPHLSTLVPLLISFCTERYEANKHYACLERMEELGALRACC